MFPTGGNQSNFIYTLADWSCLIFAVSVYLLLTFLVQLSWACCSDEPQLLISHEMCRDRQTSAYNTSRLCRIATAAYTEYRPPAQIWDNSHDRQDYRANDSYPYQYRQQVHAIPRQKSLHTVKQKKPFSFMHNFLYMQYNLTKFDTIIREWIVINATWLTFICTLLYTFNLTKFDVISYATNHTVKGVCRQKSRCC